MPKRYRSPRLQGFDYTGPLAAHLVFVTRQRLNLFREPELARVCFEALLEATTKLNATLHAYCIMPNHVHVLVEVGAGTPLTEVARRFKLLSGFRLRQLTGDFAWQVSYYDHVLRKEEALEDIAHYIWQNPVEEGLARGWLDYPYSGPRDLMR